MSGEPIQTTDYNDVHDRFNRDPQFATLVNLMTQFIVKNKYTPSEMRDAAFMASLQFEHIYRITEHRMVFRDGEGQ